MPDPQGDVQPGTQEVRAVRGAAADTIQQYYLYRPRADDGRDLGLSYFSCMAGERGGIIDNRLTRASTLL